MSASREKKQRQSMDGMLTEKERKEAAEAQKTKNKHIAYAVIGVVAVVLVAALLIWDSGIIQRGQAAKTVALTVGDQTFTAADLDFYYFQNYQTMAQYGIVNASTNLKEEASMFGEGTWHESFLESAKTSLTQVGVLCSEAQKAGYTISEDGKATVQANVDSMKSAAKQNNFSYSKFLQLNYGTYMTPEAFERCLEMAVLADEYQAEKTGQFPVEESEMTAYYEEHKDELDLITYTVYTIDGAAESTTDADGNTVDPTEEEKTAAMEAAKDNADAIAEMLKDKRTPSESDLTSYKATATATESEASGSSLSSNYSEWLLGSRKDGDVTVIEGTDCYYAVQFLGRESYLDANDYDPRNVRYMLIRAEVDEGASEPTEEQMNAAKATADDLLAQFQAGEQTGEAFAALAEANSDKIYQSNLMENVPEGSTTEDFDAWLYDSARKAGDSGVVVDNYYGGHHVVYFEGVSEDGTVWRQNLTATLQNTAFSDWLTETSGTYTVTDGDMTYVG